MNAIKIATSITTFANRVAKKLLVWRWKANLAHARASIVAAEKTREAAARTLTLASSLEADADKQLAEAKEIREAADKLEV